MDEDVNHTSEPHICVIADDMMAVLCGRCVFFQEFVDGVVKMCEKEFITGTISVHSLKLLSFDDISLSTLCSYASFGSLQAVRKDERWENIFGFFCPKVLRG